MPKINMGIKVAWKPIRTAPVNTFVLVACRSGYVGIKWIYRVAKFTKGYHDRWDDEGNDALEDDGHRPEWWAHLPIDPPGR